MAITTSFTSLALLALLAAQPTSTAAQSAFAVAPLGACPGAGSLTAPSGTITDGPQAYGDSMHCEWQIQSEMQISLSFSSFDTEAYYDYVKVYEGPTLLGSFNGSALPAPLTARSGSMRVLFFTDGSVTREGFMASYSTAGASVPMPASPPPTTWYGPAFASLPPNLANLTNHTNSSGTTSTASALHRP